MKLRISFRFPRAYANPNPRTGIALGTRLIRWCNKVVIMESCLHVYRFCWSETAQYENTWSCVWILLQRSPPLEIRIITQASKCYRARLAKQVIFRGNLVIISCHKSKIFLRHSSIRYFTITLCSCSSMKFIQICLVFCSLLWIAYLSQIYVRIDSLH